MRRLPNLLFEVAEKGTWVIEDEHGTRLEAPAGRGFVVPAEQSHNLIYEGPAQGVSHWHFIALQDRLGRELSRNIRGPSLLSAGETKWLCTAIGLAMTKAETLAQLLEMQVLRMRIAERLLGQAGCEAMVPMRVDPRIEAVMRHIDEHLAEGLSRETLAEVAHLSPTRFHYVFMEATGRAPTQYVIERRLAMARDLLGATKLSVKEIAMRCGYRDAARFSGLFKKHLGQSPMGYRARVREKVEP
jgi:AraC-like DNA-binding protein